MAKEKAKKLTKRSLPPEVKMSLEAGLAKKAEDVRVLDLRELSSFTDYFLVMHGNSSRQNAAISDYIAEELKKGRVRPLSVEGRENAEWVLMDYGHFIVHIFSPKAREYYSLEKLWGDAPSLSVKPKE